MGFGIGEVGGQDVVGTREPTKGKLRLVNTRGAGADEHTDTRRAVTSTGRRHSRVEAVGAQNQLGQAVVATVEARRVRGERATSQSLNPAHWQIELAKSARFKRRPSLAQGRRHGVTAAPGGGD